MTALRKGDVVLVSFPFTDASGSKRRPAVVISSEHYNQTSPDVVIASLTSNLGAVPHPGDYVLFDWQEANLLSPTLLQMKIATVEATVIVRQLGRLSPGDLNSMDVSLAKALDL